MPTKAELEEQLLIAQEKNTVLVKEMDTLKKDVVAKARELAAEHDWCSVVDQALEELELLEHKSYDITLTLKVGAVPQLPFEATDDEKSQWLKRLVGTEVNYSEWSTTWGSTSEEGASFEWQLEVVEQ